MALMDRFRGWLHKEINAAVVTTANAASWAELFAVNTATTVTANSAIRHAAVYRCVSLISGTLAMLPLKTYRIESDGDRTEITSDPAVSVLSIRPNGRYSRVIMWKSAVFNMLLRGNGLIWIERQRNGNVKALWHVPWSRVSVTLLTDNDLWYKFQLDNMELKFVNQDDVLHLPGSLDWNGLMAKTPIQAMGSAVGIGLSADGFAKDYFDNGGTPSGTISYPHKFFDSAGQSAELRRHFLNTFSADKRFAGPLVLDQGGKFEETAVTAEDAQILETRRFQIEDIGRIFGVPRHLLGLDDTSWGSGIEALGMSFVTYTLGPHLRAIEDEINWKIWRNTGIVSEFDTSELLRGDIKSRFDSYRGALGGSGGPGFMTPNEVRRREGLPTLDGYDTLTKWTQGKTDGVKNDQKTA